jgi:hypothetical protein
MVVFAYAVLSVAIAGAIASWVVALVYFVRTLAALGPEQHGLRWRLMVAWLVTVRKLKGAAADYAAVVHKAMLVFFVCLIAGAGGGVMLSVAGR